MTDLDQTETMTMELCTDSIHVFIYASRTGEIEKPQDDALCFCKTHKWGEFKDGAEFQKWGNFEDLINVK